MNPKIYQIEYLGKIKTVKSCGGPLDVARRILKLPNKYIPWQNINDKITIIGQNIIVEEIDIPLSWVQWG